ncbi:MAG TPA: energy transducer TonB, partial [Pyrinomonadaceae bacterium]|nr:energy transducer TonB [Pyrinomonadaceae bacterium]
TEATQTNNTPDASNVSPDAPAEAAPAEAQPEEVVPQTADPAAAALAARREREARERWQRERERRADEARKNEQADKPSEAPADAAKPAAPVVSGPKVVRVSVSYDENGRVTQASVAGATPGAEAYGATAVRVARSRRFPAGKPGGTVISIPVN